MTRYFDASALVKRYVREAGSVMVRRMLVSATVATSRLSEVEIASGIARRTREGALTPARRDRALAALQRDLPAFAVVEVIPEITADARTLLLRHPLRAGDAIQLASCLYLQRQLNQPVPFVAFDQRLLDAARTERVAVVASMSRRQPTRGPFEKAAH